VALLFLWKELERQVRIEGYAEKKEGKDCQAAGGEMLKGFHDAIQCDASVAGSFCLPFAIVDTQVASTMYVGACNLTATNNVYIAVKFFENNEWRSQGWWGVETNKCRKVGPFPNGNPIYAVAMNSSEEPVLREWTPTGEKVKGCINSEVGFLYGENANGACEARESISDAAPAPSITIFGKLVEAGYTGVATFNILP
jgi:hypothetical protein